MRHLRDKSRPRWRSRALAGGMMACALCIPQFALSQEQTELESGLEVTFSYTERLLWDDGDASARSDLGLSLTSETRTQRFAFSVNSSLDKTTSDFSWEDTSADLRYGIENRNAVLEFDARYLRTDADSLTFDEDLGDGTLVLDEGDREDIRSNVLFEFGRAAPFGGTLRLGYAETNYIDTSSTSLIDSTTQTLGLGLRFDIDPRISARLSFDHSDLDRDGGLDVRRDTLSAGVTLDVSKTLVADIDLGHTRVIESGSVARTETDGVFTRLALRQEMPNGTLSGSIVSDLDENGRRTTARIDRALELPRARLSFGLGLSRNDDSDKTRPLYALNYTQDLPRGEFTVALDQAFSTNSAGTETLNSRLTLSTRQNLTSLSVLTGSLSFRESNVLGAAGDTTQIDLSLNYARSLTEDWTLIGGYTHTRRNRDSGNDDIDDVVFIGLRTTRLWRP